MFSLRFRHFSTSFPARGLEEFFETGNKWIWRDTELMTGRPWTAPLLRQKSFEDLHKLWWICIKEQNKLVSQKEEATRFRLVFPHGNRLAKTRQTMARLKYVLWERKIAYQQAIQISEIEKFSDELIAQGKTDDETLKLVQEKFPVKVENVGKNTVRFKLQERFKKIAESNRKKPTPERTFIE